MRRWSVWVVVAIPALVGLVSLAIGSGDLRASGLMAGVALTIVGGATVVLVRGRWRDARGVRRLVRLVPIVAAGLVGVLGLAAGVPEFAQARFGWFVPADAYGARAVVATGGTFVVIGDEREGVVVLRSGDGRTWSKTDDVPGLEDLHIADAVATADGIVAIGQPVDGDVAHVVTSRDGQTWQATAQFGPEVGFGIAPSAIAAARRGFVALAGIYGNDAAFFHSPDGRKWSAGTPSPVFDDHEDAHDVACSSAGCVAVGERFTSRGISGGTRRAVSWTSSSEGDPWVQADGVFGEATVAAVTTSDDVFLAGGHDPTRDRAVLWTSPTGHAWTPVGADQHFDSAAIDGVTDLDGTLIAFGRDHHSGAIVVWTSDDASRWRRSTVEDGTAAESRIRAVAAHGGTTVAVGIDAADNSTAIWASDDLRSWRRATVADHSS
jgi:hypothetical protein